MAGMQSRDGSQYSYMHVQLVKSLGWGPADDQGRDYRAHPRARLAADTSAPPQSLDRADSLAQLTGLLFVRAD